MEKKRRKGAAGGEKNLKLLQDAGRNSQGVKGQREGQVCT